MPRTPLSITLTLLTTLLATPALAQSPAPTSSTDVAGATVDRQTTDNKMLGADIGFSVLDDLDDGSILRFDLYGQFMTNAGGSGKVGFFGSLPFMRVSFDGESESAVGNPEFGALFVPRTSGLDVILRLGIVPSLLGVDDAGVGFVGGLARLTDLITQFPDTTLLRLSASPLIRSGALFIRLDAGLDVPLSSDDFFEADPIARFNAAVGGDMGSFLVVGELVNLVNIGDETEFIHAFGVTGQGKVGNTKPFVSLSFPLDEDLRELVTFTLIAGVRFAPM